jgi:hypothetical protein
MLVRNALTDATYLADKSLPGMLIVSISLLKKAPRYHPHSCFPEVSFGFLN